MNTSWKFKNFEKSSKEFHVNTFRSLEIENYLKKVLRKKDIDTFNLKLNFSGKTLTVFFSVRCWEKDLTTRATLTKTLVEGGNKRSRKELLREVFECVRQFTGGKFHIVLKIKALGEKQLKKNALNLSLDRFRIPELKKLYQIIDSQTNSTELLGIFIAKHLRATKRHNFFFSSLHASLSLLLKQKKSKIKGIKILIKGRMNNAPRSRNKILKIGKVPLLTESSQAQYAATTAFTPNGTVGIKLWINRKKEVYTTI